MDKIKVAIGEKRKIGFEVTNPQKSYAGYTVYRLQLKIYVLEPDVTHYHFLGWKRYNDFKKLHKDLKSVFPDEIRLGFPVFPKGKIFGRFDESVIEERRQTSIGFLQFISSNQEMVFHPHFQNFITGNEPKKDNDQEVDSTVSYTSLIGELVELPSQESASEQILNDEDEVFDDADYVGDISIENSIDNRQSWLREAARSICESDIELDTPVPSSEASVLLDDPLVNDSPPSPVSADGLEPIDVTTTEDSGRMESEGCVNSMATLDMNDRCGITSFNQKFDFDDRMSQRIEETVLHDDYVFQASVAMSNAIEQEELGNYDAAFDMYKFGIGLLLCGVQKETNTERREAVRRKTAQYLMRAEQLYTSSLKTSEEKKSRTLPVIGDTKWRFRLSDVKVFGIIRNVMLVQKGPLNTVYVMKVLHKKGAEYKSTLNLKRKVKKERNLYNCRFMTKLISCVETQTGVYLLLEYVPGGRLFDYLNLPIFASRCNRHISFSENHHSWTSADCNSNGNIDINGNHRGIIDGKSESFENDKNRVTSVTCRFKRTVTQTGYAEDFIRLWAAQIALGLMALHNYGVICRDLNPKNILIDTHGNINLTYFSNVDGIDYTLDPDAVVYLYTSPEVEHVGDVNKSTDWWSYGAIIFELLIGESLYSCHPNGINNCSVISLPRRVSNEACSLLASFLQYNPRDRLGSGPHGSEEIKSHAFFKGIDWEQLPYHTIPYQLDT